MDFAKQCRDIEAAFQEIEHAMADPAVASVPAKYREIAKKHRELGRIVEKWREFERAAASREEALALAGDPDPEMAALARVEAEQADAALARCEQDLTLLLLPADPMDSRGIVMEIRAGTGGEEAALFAGDLVRMYGRYAERQGWTFEALSTHPTELGGFKEAVFEIEGEDVYRRLKYESGTHRVQRVPDTETQGRIHTSAITVAVMPRAEEVDVEVKPEDLRVDVFRSSGPGGQSVNTTDSAVRITHLPTNITVSCQDEKSQHKNKAKAMRVLRSRILEAERARREAESTAQRREQVGTGDRSGRIRTYNFPQNRVTDHRIGLTLHKLDQIVEGDLDEILDALLQDEQMRKLAQFEAAESS